VRQRMSQKFWSGVALTSLTSCYRCTRRKENVALAPKLRDPKCLGQSSDTTSPPSRRRTRRREMFCTHTEVTRLEMWRPEQSRDEPDVSSSLHTPKKNHCMCVEFTRPEISERSSHAPSPTSHRHRVSRKENVCRHVKVARSET
jgi:hypothetical protein